MSTSPTVAASATMAPARPSEAGPLPKLSLVMLTSNDAHAATGCLAALGRQHARDFEVLVVDSGSTDGTVAAVRAQRASLPFPIRLLAGKRMPVGMARDLGVALARAPLVAFVRPDARPGPDWVAAALETLTVTDLAYRPAGPRPKTRARSKVRTRAARPARPSRVGRHRRRKAFVHVRSSRSRTD